MSITAVFVLFSVVWFLVLFVVLQSHPHSQADAGEIVKGTHASAPADLNMKRKALITTLISLPVTAFVIWFILSGILSMEYFDFFGHAEN